MPRIEGEMHNGATGGSRTPIVGGGGRQEGGVIGGSRKEKEVTGDNGVIGGTDRSETIFDTTAV
jgi:hypothetical protein